MAKSSSASGGIGFMGMLFIAFLVLKLTGFITWSWWYVTMPLWGGIALILGMVAIAFIIAFIVDALHK